jgi:ribosomal subunit interface protein
MNHNIKTSGLEFTPELRDYVERKLAQEDKFLTRDSTAHVDIELQFAEGERDKQYRAEFTAETKHGLYRAEARGYSMHEAVDAALSDLTREITNAKKKRIRVLRHSAGRVKDFLRGFRRNV